MLSLILYGRVPETLGRIVLGLLRSTPCHFCSRTHEAIGSLPLRDKRRHLRRQTDSGVLAAGGRGGRGGGYLDYSDPLTTSIRGRELFRVLNLHHCICSIRDGATCKSASANFSPWRIVPRNDDHKCTRLEWSCTSLVRLMMTWICCHVWCMEWGSTPAISMFSFLRISHWSVLHPYLVRVSLASEGGGCLWASRSVFAASPTEMWRWGRGWGRGGLEQSNRSC